MSEPRKNLLAIDGGQAKDVAHVDAYKPISESDTDFRPSKPHLSKSKEKVSDEAEEKLLQKEDEARITTRVDMADAKYVVGDHRNGDAKIELDANKRQFSGLTKEELLKYADDPFWVRLRWCMFALFWTLWLCMLAGAIAIIVRAPKCAPPPPKTWFEIGPIADMSSVGLDYTSLESDLSLLESSKVQGIFIKACEDTYDVLDTPSSCLESFKEFVKKAKEYSIKVIVDLTANFVSTSHDWFEKSVNNTAEFGSYFIWAKGQDFDLENSRPKLPNNWVSTADGTAWTWNEQRKEYFLHQYGADEPDLNFTNPAVVAHFDAVLALWMQAGAAGVRLLKARQLFVSPGLESEERDPTSVAVHAQYSSLRHSRTTDQPPLDGLLAHWSHVVATNGTGDTVFTLAEDGRLGVEWHRLQRNASCLRPPSAAPVLVAGNITAVADALAKRLGVWPALQLIAPHGGDEELATLAMLLPAAPVLTAEQLQPESNDTVAAESFAHLVELRADASIQHGHYAVAAVPEGNGTAALLLACARWKSGHTGYAAVYNPGESEARANLTALQSVPATLSVHYVSHQVRAYTNYTINLSVPSEDVLVPPKSTVVLSYVPKTIAEQ